MTIKTSAYYRRGAYYPRYTLHVAGKCIHARVVERACLTKEEAIEVAENIVNDAKRLGVDLKV